MAALVVLALVAPLRLARAEVSASVEQALRWQAQKQANEIDLVLNLRSVFDNDRALQEGVQAYARAVLAEIKNDLDNSKVALPVAGKVLSIAIRGVAAPAGSGDEVARARSKLDAALAISPVPVGMLGDVLWLHSHVVSAIDDDRRRAMFATKNGIARVSSDAVWSEAVDRPGRLRVSRGHADFEAVKVSNDAGDAEHVHATIAERASARALATTALRPGSVVATITRAFGLTMGADISGSTNIYVWQLKRFGMDDPIWRLIPIVTLAADFDHTLLEVALVLESHGFVEYRLGDYETLLPRSSHPSAKQVAKVLAQYTADARNHLMYCWYGTSNKVEACRRSSGTDPLGPFAVATVYTAFYTWLANVTTTNALNSHRFPSTAAAFEGLSQ